MSLSLGTAAVGFLLGDPALYGVMRLGDRFERWCTCAWSSRSLMPTTGNHHPRYRVVRIRFECRVRTAKSPARGPEWTDPHQEARPAIASARPCIMIVGRRYETEDAGRATSASIGPEIGTDRGPTQRMIPTRRGTTRVVDSSPTRSPGLNSKNTELSLSSQARPMPRLNVGPLSVSMSPNGTYAPTPPSA